MDETEIGQAIECRLTSTVEGLATAIGLLVRTIDARTPGVAADLQASLKEAALAADDDENGITLCAIAAAI